MNPRSAHRRNKVAFMLVAGKIRDGNSVQARSCMTPLQADFLGNQVISCFLLDDW